MFQRYSEYLYTYFIYGWDHFEIDTESFGLYWDYVWTNQIADVTYYLQKKWQCVHNYISNIENDCYRSRISVSLKAKSNRNPASENPWTIHLVR